MKRYKDLYTGLVVFFVSLFYLINTNSIRIFSGAGATAVNARTIPIIEGLLLMLLSIIMLIRFGFKERNTRRTGEVRKESSTGTVAVSSSFRVRMAVPFTLLLLLLYVLAIGRLGFVITSMVYLFFQIIILSPEGKPRYVINTIISIACPVIVYLIFVYLLNVPLPSGSLPF